MVQARIINDTTKINVKGEDSQKSVSVKSQSSVNNVRVRNAVSHDTLSNRSLPDQHPISSISGLEEVLNKLWTFTFEQAVASDTWIIKHNLGRNPSVVVVDSAGTVFYPAIQYDNENQCTVTMNGSTTGMAYLN